MRQTRKDFEDAVTPGHTFSLVACARWENRAILGWPGYHRLIGVDHVYRYPNDDTSTLKTAVGPRLEGCCPLLTCRHWHLSKGGQAHTYSHLLSRDRFETEWLCLLDFGEFLAIKEHNDLPRFVAPPRAQLDSVYPNWVLYGGKRARDARPGQRAVGPTRRNLRVDRHTRNFIRSRCADPRRIGSRISIGSRAYWHFWDDHHLHGLRVCDVLGVKLLHYTDKWPTRAKALVDRPGFREHALATAYVARFQFKSEADFKRRAAQGRSAGRQAWRKVFEEGRHRASLAKNDAAPDTDLRDF